MSYFQFIKNSYWRMQKKCYLSERVCFIIQEDLFASKFSFYFSSITRSYQTLACHFGVPWLIHMSVQELQARWVTLIRNILQQVLIIPSEIEFLWHWCWLFKFVFNLFDYNWFKNLCHDLNFML
jgi:hypothetical protein